LIGPNCLGLMNPLIGLNATFAQDIALPGNVAFLSQSGALLTAILDWSLAERAGFSAIVSTGSMLDVGWGDLLSFFERLIRKCFLDYDREIALVAERVDKHTGLHELIGVGRLARQRQMDEAELGVVVADRCQRAGLGTELVRRLLQIARAEKIRRVEAHILSENSAMVALAKHFHFDCVPDEDLASLTATLHLDGPRKET